MTLYHPTIPHYTQPKGHPMNKSLIDQMVDRFLGWKLPSDFNPDGGITFKPDFNEGTQFQVKHVPMGTNLLDAIQAKSMLEAVAAPSLDRVAVLESMLLRCRDALVVVDGRPCDGKHLIAAVNAVLAP